MVYPADFEQKLGFDQLRQRLANYCLCPPGQRKVEALGFHSRKEQLVPLLLQNKEMCVLLTQANTFPFTHFFDPSELYGIIAIEGAFLEEGVFRQIILSLQSILEARQFLQKNQESYPQLY
jgi:DNA mismatch repair protein MutS2